MRIHILSDLHLEQADFSPPDVDADVIVLAGDIGSGTAGVTWAQERLAGRPVLYLAGNHEFYGEDFPGLLPRLRSAAAGSDIHVLEDDELVIDGVRFLGATLWSDFAIGGTDRRDWSMGICERVVNDYRVIAFDGNGERRRLLPADTLATHLASRRWLDERLREPFDGPTVVLTHHGPIAYGQPPKEQVLRAVGGAFISDLTDLMGAGRVALWIFGHTHRSADLMHDGTRIISNPRGYPRETVAGFDPGLVVEV